MDKIGQNSKDVVSWVGVHESWIGEREWWASECEQWVGEHELEGIFSKKSIHVKRYIL